MPKVGTGITFEFPLHDGLFIGLVVNAGRGYSLIMVRDL